MGNTQIGTMTQVSGFCSRRFYGAWNLVKASLSDDLNYWHSTRKSPGYAMGPIALLNYARNIGHWAWFIEATYMQFVITKAKTNG